MESSALKKETSEGVSKLGLPKTEAALNEITAKLSGFRKKIAERRAAQETEAKPKKEPKPTPEKEPKPAAKGDFGAYEGLASSDEKLALESLAHDIYMATYPQRNVTKELNEITAALVRGEMPNIKFGKTGSDDFIAGTGGKYAEAYYNSLTDDQKAQLRKRLEYFFITAEAQKIGRAHV